MELMEVREQLEEHKHAPTELLRTSLLASLSDLQARQAECDNEVDALCEKFDVASTLEARKSILSQIRKVMLKKNFLRSLARTIDSELNPSEV